MSFPHGTLPTLERVHPTPIYEVLASIIIAFVIWRWCKLTRRGLATAYLLLLMGFERLLVEFLRRNSTVLLGLTMAQLTSLLIIALAIVLLRVFVPRNTSTGECSLEVQSCHP